MQLPGDDVRDLDLGNVPTREYSTSVDRGRRPCIAATCALRSLAGSTRRRPYGTEAATLVGSAYKAVSIYPLGGVDLCVSDDQAHRPNLHRRRARPVAGLQPGPSLRRTAQVESLAKPFAITGARRLSDRQAAAWPPADSAWQTLLMVVRQVRPDRQPVPFRNPLEGKSENHRLARCPRPRLSWPTAEPGSQDAGSPSVTVHQ